MERLAATIVERKSKVRDLITAFRNSTRRPFPAWGVPAAEKSAVKKSVVQ
jgi:hypothetical protein